jgi:hypothetical protein
MNLEIIEFFLKKSLKSYPKEYDFYIFFSYRAWGQLLLNLLLWYSVGDHFMSFWFPAIFIFGVLFLFENICLWWFKTPYKDFNGILDLNIFNLPTCCSLPLFFSFWIYLNIFENTYLIDTRFDGTPNWIYIFALRLLIWISGFLLLSGQLRMNNNYNRIK